MHLYAYDDLDSIDEKASLQRDALSTSRPVIDEIFIVIDEDEDGEPDDILLPLSQRPRIGLPKRSSNTTRNLEQGKNQDAMNLEQSSNEDEIFQSMSCMPGLRDKSFEELRLECYLQTQVATGSSPKPAEHPSSAIPPSFMPWCQESSVQEYTVTKKARVASEHDPLPKLSHNLVGALAFSVPQVLVFQ